MAGVKTSQRAVRNAPTVLEIIMLHGVGAFTPKPIKDKNASVGRDSAHVMRAPLRITPMYSM